MFTKVAAHRGYILSTAQEHTVLYVIQTAAHA